MLVDHADELLDCIKSLKRLRKRGALSPQSLDSGMRNTIALLGGNLPAALQVLGGEPRPAARPKTSPPEQSPTRKRRHEFLSTISPPTSITAWNASDVSKKTLDKTPPLPSVLDAALETAALTHAGSNKSPGANYERLEWIGDAYLYLISSSLIYQTFTTLSPGRCAQLREILVRNSTLAEFSVRYKLDKRAKIPPEFKIEGRDGGTTASEKERMKVLADMFEAYVGAIILSDPEHGMVHASDWLKSLWASTISSEIRKEMAKPEAEHDPKTLLAKEIVVPGITLRYEDVETKKVKKGGHGDKIQHFSVGLFLDGWGETNKQLAWGTAVSKSEAGQEAARHALKNNKLIKLYSTKKKEFLAARANGSGKE